MEREGGRGGEGEDKGEGKAGKEKRRDGRTEKGREGKWKEERREGGRNEGRKGRRDEGRGQGRERGREAAKPAEIRKHCKQRKRKANTSCKERKAPWRRKMISPGQTSSASVGSAVPVAALVWIGTNKICYGI